MATYHAAVTLLNLRRDLEALPVGKSGKPHGAQIRKLWVAALDALVDLGHSRAAASKMVEETALPFRR